MNEQIPWLRYGMDLRDLQSQLTNPLCAEAARHALLVLLEHVIAMAQGQHDRLTREAT